MEVMKNDIKTIFKQLKNLEDRVDVVETKLHQKDVDELRRDQALKDLITEAVEKGNVKQSVSIEKLHKKVEDMDKKYDERNKDVDIRIVALEEAELKKLAAETITRQQNMQAQRKHAISIFISIIVTFLCTTILNMFWEAIIAFFSR